MTDSVSSSRVSWFRRMAALAMLLNSAPAWASGGDGGLFFWVVVVPAVAVVLFAILIVWNTVPLRFRPAAVAICAVPLAPVDNGSYTWPWSTYFFEWDGGITFWALAWPIALTVALTYVSTALLSKQKPSAATPPNASLERTRER